MYKVLLVSVHQAEEKINALADQGWRVVSAASWSAGHLAVVFERPGAVASHIADPGADPLSGG